MNRTWAPILRPIIAAAAARRVIEIGADRGRTSERLARWCRANGAHADIIDPAPGFDAADFERRWQDTARVHQAPSLDVLDALAGADVVLIDGDHNWYTVYHEILTLIGPADAPRADAPVMIFHDVGWPWGRRDAYYALERIPEAFRQPCSEAPISPRMRGWDPEGGVPFGMPCANVAGGPRNGVRTAIEDALAGRGDAFDVVWIEGLFGLAVVTPRARLEARPELARFLAGLRPAPALKTLIDLLELERLGGARASQVMTKVLSPPAVPAPVPSGERPLATALSTDVWRGLQQGLLSQRYKGRAFLLCPMDQYNYMSLIETLRPATIFEIGTLEGGRALWMADQLRAFGIDGRVIALDLRPPAGLADPRVELITGNALDLEAALPAARLASLPHPWLVIEDAAHTEPVTRAVLDHFDPHLAPGDRLVVEDGNTGSLSGTPEAAPVIDALRAFLAGRGQDYQLETEVCDRYGYNMTANPNGWLRRL
ncbi:CmcI family methyltransferase [Xanthobacter sp. V4C-4]|uniref:class I SAM-dependent methyltransferase n=1 Tax=Xanthobacter cornucopiae TaxID=3119924 RepID=UPI00372CE6ED